MRTGETESNLLIQLSVILADGACCCCAVRLYSCSNLLLQCFLWSTRSVEYLNTYEYTPSLGSSHDLPTNNAR